MNNNLTQLEIDEEVKYQFIKRDDESTMEEFSAGSFTDIQMSIESPVEEIINYGFEKHILNEILLSFPDPRKSFDVPINVVLLPQILQRLNNEAGQVSAPYLLNDAKLMAQLGYNSKKLEKGFNDEAQSPRKTRFHGEVLNHILNSVTPDKLINWYSTYIISSFIEPTYL